MTLTELKSLKVGQVVKYTNDVDALNVEYWEVDYTSENGLILQDYKRKHIHNVISFDDPDINHIASMLTIDRPLWDKMGDKDRQLRLVEAKIRDAEFDVRAVMRETEFMYKIHGSLSGLMQEEIVKAREVLIELRHQRNKLIENI